jgi:hypothetical protein
LIEFNPEKRNALASPDLTQLEKQFRGATFADLIQEHVRKTGNRLPFALVETLSCLNHQEQQVSEQLFDEFNELAYDIRFWRRDCGDALLAFCGSFVANMRQCGYTVENVGVYAFFQSVTLHFALQALQQKELRKFAGIRKGLLFR